MNPVAVICIGCHPPLVPLQLREKNSKLGCPKSSACKDKSKCAGIYNARKPSCMTARGVPPLSCPGARYPCPVWGYLCSAPGVPPVLSGVPRVPPDRTWKRPLDSSSYRTVGYPPRQDLKQIWTGPVTGIGDMLHPWKRPGTRDRERTWDNRLRYPLPVDRYTCENSTCP